jgi:hypothetical protein
MWALTNRTPYQVDRTWVRDKEGNHHWIVVAKATYTIDADGTLRLSDDPVAPLHAPEYNGAPGQSSLRYEADLVAMKPGTDTYLNAIAYSPGGKPRTEVKVSLQIDRLRKELMVYGNRTWSASLTGGVAPSSPEPFETMPITYERAFGGCDQEDPNPLNQRIDFRNPVGTGVAAQTGRLIGKPGPNIEDPSRKFGKGWPPGFGAIASYWSPRKELAGTYDEQWVTRRKPLLPADFDPRWLLCSPLDQRPSGYLMGGELVEMTNLTPNGRLRFTLPSVSLRFDTYFGSTRREHQAQLVSVVIESEGPRVILVWQTSLPSGRDVDYLDKTVIQQLGQSQ